MQARPRMERYSSYREKLVHAGRVLALASTYVVLGKLGLMMSPVSGAATLVWAPAGVALAALLLGGYGLWPGVAIGALVTALSMGLPPWVAASVAVGNTAQALLGAFALRRVPGFRPALDRFTDVVALALVALGSSLISSTIGVLSLALAGAASAGFDRTWLVWWMGDLIGILVVTPMLLTWAGSARVAVRPAVLAEAVALGVCLGTCAALAFGYRPEVVNSNPILLPYILFLPLIWAGLRFGARGAATASLLLAGAAVWGTYNGYGGFARSDRTASLIALHVFLASASLSALVLGSVISERDRVTKELRESESALRGVMNGMPDPIYVKDRLGRYLVVNAACAWVFGLTEEAAVGKHDFETFTPEEASALRANDEEVVRTGEARVTEERLTVAGRRRVYRTTKAPYRDGSGNVIGVIGISSDITEHKSEELARAWLASAIVDFSADAVFSKTLDGTITSWNAAAVRMFGYSREEAIGERVWMLVPPARSHELREMFERLKRGERVENHETVRRRKDGTEVEVALTLSPICDATGNAVGSSAIARDITARNRVEKQLRDSEERQRLAVEAAHLGMWFWDLKSDLVVWTPLCRSQHGIGAEEPAGYARFLASVHPDDRARIDHEIRCALERCAEYTIEYRVVRDDGSVRWLSGFGRVLPSKEGKPERVLGVTRDITDQKNAEQQRAELLLREQAATRAKDEFLAVLSHELRAPLQSMLGWTQIVRAPGADARLVQKGMDTIERNIVLQTKLIEDLLDVSRIVAGKLRLERRRVELKDLVESAVASAKVAADAKSIRIDKALDRRRSAVRGDPARLGQVVSNLLSNAVKFTPIGGRVSVALGREGDRATITVADTGVGIAPEFLPHVFERFRQAESTMHRSHGGLGLGLAIVRHLVELQGGTVSAASDGKDRGTTFTVTLPLLDDEPQPAVVESAPIRASDPGNPENLEGVRVLVVDDDPDARELLQTMLNASGAEVHAVGSAPAAFAAITTFHPDLLLSDVGMPGEDGYALIRRLRAKEATEGGHLPAVALTAFASQSDREQAIELGFEAHLAKPANGADLVRTLASLVHRAM